MYTQVKYLKLFFLLLFINFFMFSGNAIASIPYETRDEMIQIAGPYTKVPWRLVFANNSEYKPDGAKYMIKQVYGFSEFRNNDDYSSGEYTGEAYSFGSNDKIGSFINKINNLKKKPRNWADNYNNNSTTRGEFTGIDCSAYVSIIWKIPRQGTGGLAGDTYCYAIDINGILYGDIFNKSGDHTVLVYSGPYGLDDNKYQVYQASGSQHKVLRNEWIKYNGDGFYPRRRRNISSGSDTTDPSNKFLTLKDGATVWGEKYPIDMQVSDTPVVKNQLGVPDVPQEVYWEHNGDVIHTNDWGIPGSLSSNIRKYSIDLPTRPTGKHYFAISSKDWKNNRKKTNFSMTRKSASRISGSDRWATMKEITPKRLAK